MDVVKKLYNSLDNMRYKKYSLPTNKIETNDLNALLSIKESDLEELKNICDDYCFAALILDTCGQYEFYRVMDILMCELPQKVFRYIIDYDGNFTDGGNPIDSGTFELKEMLDVIDMYYDSRYYLIYQIESYSEFPTYVHHVIGNDKENGRKKILKELEDRYYTEEMFNVQVLDDIWEEYHG